MIRLAEQSARRLSWRWAAERAAWFIPGGLLILALVARVLLIWQTRFDGLYGQDSFAYLDYAAAMKTSLGRGELPPPFFWPIGYPTLSIAFSLFLPLNPAAQAVSVMAGALAGVLAYLMTREILEGQPHATVASLFAGLIIAFSGQMLISSLSAMSDAAGVFWASLFAFALTRSYRSKAKLGLALAGFALGWAVMTRWIYALLIPIWVTALLIDDHRGTSARQSLACAAIVLTFFFLGMSPQIALMIDQASRGSLSYIGDLQTYRWNPTNAWQSDIVNADGHFIYAKPIAAFYAMPLVHPSYIVLFLTPLVLLGAWALRREKFYSILLAGWISVMWFFLGGVAWENWRFPLAYFPPLTILVGVGFNALAVWIPKILAPSMNKLLGAACGASLIFTLAWGVRDVNNFTARQLADRTMAEWTSAHLPADGTVITFGITETLQHFTPLKVVEIYDESPSSVERVAHERRDVFVLLDVKNVESQWSGLSPQVNYHILRDRFNLQVVGTYGPYVLFSIGSAQ